MSKINPRRYILPSSFAPSRFDLESLLHFIFLDSKVQMRVFFINKRVRIILSGRYFGRGISVWDPLDQWSRLIMHGLQFYTLPRRHKDTMYLSRLKFHSVHIEVGIYSFTGSSEVDKQRESYGHGGSISTRSMFKEGTDSGQLAIIRVMNVTTHNHSILHHRNHGQHYKSHSSSTPSKCQSNLLFSYSLCPLLVEADSRNCCCLCAARS